jgi:hypothetical protein
MRMMGGICQDILYDPARSFSSALILFLDDVNFETWFYVFSILAVHTLRFGKSLQPPKVQRGYVLILKWRQPLGRRRYSTLI